MRLEVKLHIIIVEHVLLLLYKKIVGMFYVCWTVSIG